MVSASTVRARHSATVGTTEPAEIDDTLVISPVQIAGDDHASAHVPSKISEAPIDLVALELQVHELPDQCEDSDQQVPSPRASHVGEHPRESQSAEVAEILAAVPQPHESVAVRTWLGSAEQALVETQGVARAQLLRARAGVMSQIVGPGSVAGSRDAYRDNIEAAEIFEREDDAVDAAIAYVSAAIVAVRADHISESLDTAVRGVIAFATGPGSDRRPSDEADMALMLGELCCEFFDYDRALQFFEIALRSVVFAQHPQQWITATTRVIEVTVVQALEASARSARKQERIVERAEELARRLIEAGEQDTSLTARGSRLLASVLLLRGEAEQAWRLLLVADKQAAAVNGSQLDRGLLALLRARCLRQLGRTIEALAQLDNAVSDLKVSRDLAAYIQTLRLRSLVREKSGDLVGALADARQMATVVWTREQRQAGGVTHQVWVRAGVEDERRMLEAQARDLVRTAEQDPLTGLVNRRALERFCATLPARESISLVLIDVDFFKQVNDKYGHSIGDVVLCEVAGILASSVRPGDRVARWGGEEFLVALPAASSNVAEAIATRVRQQVSVFDWSGIAKDLRVTLSAGVSSGYVGEIEDALERADEALYAAKRSGRNRVILG